MKNNKIDSDILDDNYFPKEIPPSPSIKFYFFKTIGYAVLNTTLFTFFVILFFTLITPIGNLEIFYVLFLAFSPFLYEIYRQYKDEDLVDSNWKIWVCVLSFLGFMFISNIAFAISSFHYGG